MSRPSEQQLITELKKQVAMTRTVFDTTVGDLLVDEGLEELLENPVKPVELQIKECVG